MKIRQYTDDLGLESDLELTTFPRENLEVNINQDNQYFYLYIFNGNEILFTIKANRKIDIDDYLFVNNLKVTNDFVKKIFNN